MVGKGDIDVLFHTADREIVDDFVRELGWFQAGWGRAPQEGIIHYFKFDDDLTIFHLHAYFGVTTGESGLKEFKFPIETKIFAGRFWDSALGLWFPSTSDLLSIFILRYYLKGGSWFSRFMLTRERASYQKEWKDLADRIEDSPGDGVFPILGIKSPQPPQGNFKLPRWQDSISLRFRLRKFLRFPAITLPYRRFGKILGLFWRRAFGPFGRWVLPSGAVVSVVGPDGSGKTSTLSEVAARLSADFRVKIFHVGKPMWVRLIRAIIMKGPNKRRTSRSLGGSGNAPPTRSAIVATLALLLAVSRQRITGRAKKYAAKGYIVLTDRWPTLGVGEIDGPRIIVNEKSPRYLKFLAKAEKQFYNRVPEADLCIFLRVDLAELLHRTGIRDGARAEVFELAESRYWRSKELGVVASKSISIENNGPFEATCAEFLGLIGPLLAERNQQSEARLSEDE